MSAEDLELQVAEALAGMRLVLVNSYGQRYSTEIGSIKLWLERYRLGYWACFRGWADDVCAHTAEDAIRGYLLTLSSDR